VLSAFFYISIPYGAIKSQFATINFAKIVRISIPYGAIKRESNKFFNSIVKIFQFLMVRLKEHF